jgi:hypothetical protein
MHLKGVAIAGLAPWMVFGRALSRRAVACDFFMTPNSGDTCESFAMMWQVPSVDALKALNPGITCPDLDTSKQYCVFGTVTDDPSTTASIQSSTAGQSLTSTQAPRTTQPPTTTKPSTTTTASAPNDTPSPTQDGMVGTCNRFHWVADGQDCASIAALYSITVSQFVQWNPAAKSDCSGLWARTVGCLHSFLSG